jgi:phosphomethylpyrimidine synthase
MNQIETARQGRVTPEMEIVARAEGVAAQTLMALVAEGKVIIPANRNVPPKKICGIGKGLSTKVNANIGTSQDFPSLERELEKLKTAEAAGADAVMDLSTGGDLRAIRRRIVEEATVCLGSVPVYDAGVTAAVNRGAVLEMTAGDMLEALRTHIEDGMDFVTVHCGITKSTVELLKRHRRVCGVVSRGGTFLSHWIDHSGQENPYYERFDEVLDMLAEADVVLSLGDGLRPGAIADAFDPPQVEELVILKELADRALAAGVQVMIEGPGHVPLSQVTAQVELQKSLTGGLPFYVLGPIVTDIAPGYDHITAAIGGAVAAAAGADFLCYVTPAEHLALPDVEQVREGVIAARIAAHAGDVAKGVPGAAEADRRISTFRRDRNWDGQIEMALDSRHADAIREHAKSSESSACSMCGKFCVFRLADGDEDSVSE